MADVPIVHYNYLRNAVADLKSAHKVLTDSIGTYAQHHHDLITRMREERGRALKLREGAERHAAGISTDRTG